MIFMFSVYQNDILIRGYCIEHGDILHHVEISGSNRSIVYLTLFFLSLVLIFPVTKMTFETY